MPQESHPDLPRNWWGFAEDHIEVWLTALADRWDVEIARGRTTIEESKPRWFVLQAVNDRPTMREAPRGTFKGEHAWRGAAAVWYGKDILPESEIDDLAVARLPPGERQRGKYGIAYEHTDRAGRRDLDLSDTVFATLREARQFVADTYEMRMRDAHALAWLQAQYRGHGGYLVNAKGLVGAGVAGGFVRGMAQREINRKPRMALQSAIAQHLGEVSVSIEAQQAGSAIYNKHGSEYLRHIYQHANNGRRLFDDVAEQTTNWLAGKQLLPANAEVHAERERRESALRAAVERQYAESEARDARAKADGSWLHNKYTRKRAGVRTEKQAQALIAAAHAEGLDVEHLWEIHQEAGSIHADGKPWAKAYKISARYVRNR